MKYEKEPKGAKSSDSTGTKKVGVSKPDSEKGTSGVSGERESKGVKAADAGGERQKSIVGGVGMGKADDCGRSAGSYDRGEMNTGRAEKTIYNHKRG